MNLLSVARYAETATPAESSLRIIPTTGLGTSAAAIVTANDADLLLIRELWLGNGGVSLSTWTAYAVASGGVASSANRIAYAVQSEPNGMPEVVIRNLVLEPGESLQMEADTASVLQVWGVAADVSGEQPPW